MKFEINVEKLTLEHIKDTSIPEEQIK